MFAVEFDASILAMTFKNEFQPRSGSCDSQVRSFLCDSERVCITSDAHLVTIEYNVDRLGPIRVSNKIIVVFACFVCHHILGTYTILVSLFEVNIEVKVGKIFLRYRHRTPRIIFF